MSAALSGFLLYLAFLDLPTRALVWVALVPWLVDLDRAGPHEGGLRAAARSGAVLAGTFWALHLSWVLVLVPRLRVVWPLPAYGGQLLLLALLGAAAGAGIAVLRARLPLPLAAAVAWMAVEWGRGALLGPLRFPWSPTALPLTQWPALVQPAAWVGEAGLGLGVMAVNGLLARAVSKLRHPPYSSPAAGRGVRGGAALPAASAALLVAVWWGAGQARLASVEVRPVAHAAAIQPAVPLPVKRDPAAAPTAARRSLENLLPAAASSGADVVVVPETHFPALLPDTTGAVVPAPEGGDSIVTWLSRWSRDTGIPILMGALVLGPRGVENSAVVVDDAGVAGRYGKVALVPGVEWAPGGGLAPGGDPRPLALVGDPGPLICIESAWGGLARSHEEAGAGWLVNLTNDGWLAGGPGWTRTPAFRQHPRHLVLRSVETGLGTLRVTNNGLTGVVSPTGTWTPLLPPHEAGVAAVQVERMRGRTMVARLGHPVGPLCTLVLLAGVVAGARRSRRRTGPR